MDSRYRKVRGMSTEPPQKGRNWALGGTGFYPMRGSSECVEFQAAYGSSGLEPELWLGSRLRDSFHGVTGCAVVEKWARLIYGGCPLVFLLWVQFEMRLDPGAPAGYPRKSQWRGQAGPAFDMEWWEKTIKLQLIAASPAPLIYGTSGSKELINCRCQLPPHGLV
jgi:hypothetical protein